MSRHEHEEEDDEDDNKTPDGTHLNASGGQEGLRYVNGEGGGGGGLEKVIHRHVPAL